ncbi:hypothetical protein MKX03_031016 [Papaver bracteatum]|nr:hypothetical protein MKX03_031016 [Papaver bracteatum]
MGMFFSQVFRLFCSTLLLFQVACRTSPPSPLSLVQSPWTAPHPTFRLPRPLQPPTGRREDKPRPPPPGPLRGPPSGRPS